MVLFVSSWCGKKALWRILGWCGPFLLFERSPSSWYSMFLLLSNNTQDMLISSPLLRTRISLCHVFLVMLHAILLHCYILETGTLTGLTPQVLIPNSDLCQLGIKTAFTPADTGNSQQAEMQFGIIFKDIDFRSILGLGNILFTF